MCLEGRVLLHTQDKHACQCYLLVWLFKLLCGCSGIRGGCSAKGAPQMFAAVGGHSVITCCSFHPLGVVGFSVRRGVPQCAVPCRCCLCGQEQRMSGVPGQRDAAGVLTDTAEADCEVCKADLWLSSVVSSTAPGRAVCAEHAAALGADPGSCTLLFRHSLEELQRLVFEAVVLFPGAAASIRSMQQHVRQRPWMKVKSLGPLMEAAAADFEPPLAPELRPGGREPGTPVAGKPAGAGAV